MGVHGLWELLAPVGRRVSVELLGNRKLAIDASIWIVQFLKAMRDDRGEVLRNAHLLGFFRRICKLMFLRVKPVFVFDGGTPYLKRRTVIARRRQREQAQSKIRKTAEKLLLNHLKSKKLEELVREEEEQGQARQDPVANNDASTSNSVQDQENADALLAASLAKEWEEEEEDEEEDVTYREGAEQHILSMNVHGKVDPTVLAALPPSMQLRLLDEMREQLVAENRQKFQSVAKAPASFSKLQIEAYLKTVAFRRDINEVQGAAAKLHAGGVPSVRIASEANREYIFSTDDGREKVAMESDSRSKVQEDDHPTASRIVPALSEGLQEQASKAVQTYFDDKGKKRVSRIRGMGVRMTRDLQWNLYLMKDKEAQDESRNGKPIEVEDEDSAFEKLVSEEHNGDIEIEWEEQDAGAENDKDIEGKSMEISFLDDGSLHADDMFEKLVLESQPEEIEWEEEDVEAGQAQAGKESVQQVIQVSFVDNESLDAEEEVCKSLLSDGEGNRQADVKAGDGSAKDLATGEDTVQVTFLDDVSLQAGEDMCKRFEEEDNTGVREDTTQVTSVETGKDEGEEVEWEEGGDVGGSTIVPSVGGVVPPYLLVEAEDLQSPALDEQKQNGVVSEEQAQIEEAIRRSLADFGVQKPFKSLTIQEPEFHGSQKEQNPAEDESSRKGKGLLYENLVPSTDTTAQTDDGIYNREFVGEARGSSNQEKSDNFRNTTEEEEQFLQAEDRRAFFEEEREKLLEEETQLRGEQKKNQRSAESVTSEMFAECQELLQMFGLPYVIAPMEAEAQCAFMDAAQLVDGVITDDSDVFLFGGRSVYKNIFDGHKYVETYYMKDAESDLGLNREKLIRMAMLLGSDYTEGISGIGIVNAIEVVNAFPEDDGLQKLKEWIESPDLMLLDKLQPKSRKSKSSKKASDLQEQDDGGDKAGVPDVDERKQVFMKKHRAVSKNWTVPASFPSDAVFEAYISPQVDKSTETFSWGRPDLELLRKFCSEKFGWSRDKADELLLPALKEYDRRETQLRLDAFYSFNQRFAKIRSSRIQKAVTGITGQRRPELMFGSTDAKKKPRKKRDDKDAPPKAKQQKTRSTKKGDGAQATETLKPRRNHPRKRKSALNNAEKKADEAAASIPSQEFRSDLTTDITGDELHADFVQASKMLADEAVISGGGFLVDDEEENLQESGKKNEVDDEENFEEIETDGGFVIGQEARFLDPDNNLQAAHGYGGGFLVDDDEEVTVSEQAEMTKNTDAEDGQEEERRNKYEEDRSLSAMPFFRKRRKFAV